MRIDKWIWSVCLVKNRTRATQLCSQGHVRLNGSVAKASKSILLGDLVEISTKSLIKVKVIKFAEKPVKKETAPLEYYEDMGSVSEPLQKENLYPKKSSFKYPQKKDGRVSKKDKRARSRLKNLF